MEPTEIQNVLEGCEFFRGFDRQQLEGIAPICRVCRYEAGESIYQQGGLGDDLYIVAEGQVVLERSVCVGPRRGSVAVAMLGKGKIFGGWSTLLDERHTLMLSAVCRKPAVLAVLKGADLRRLMTGDIRLGFAVLERLCFLLRERLQFALGAIETL